LESIWRTSLYEAKDVLTEFLESPATFSQLNSISKLLIETFRNGGRVFSCGNGGSHCDAMHFAEELTGRYRKDRRPLGALALGDPSHLTCVANDYGFEYVFSRQLLGLARAGDALLVLSTSGHSRNLIYAIEAARKIGMPVIGLLGRTGGAVKDLCSLSIVAPGKSSDRIQEIHIKIIHTLIEVIERSLFPDHYVDQESERIQTNL